MGWLDNILRREKRYNVSQEPPGWIEQWAGATSLAGVNVSEESALKFSAVWACVRILSESVAGLPLIVYRRLGDGGKERAPEHSLYSPLHDAPNGEMTSFQWREVSQAHLSTWGNAYSQIVRDRGGRVRELWPLRPDCMSVDRENGQLVYTYRQGSSTTRLSAQDVLHIPGLGFDGINGYSVIGMARQAIAVGMAADQFGGRFFENDATPGGILEHPAKLSQQAHDRLRASWDEQHRGVGNSRKVAILEEGLKYTSIGLPPEDAQFLQTKTFQIREIARMYRIPPHMLADLERASFSNIEHQALEFVIHTLRPWLVRWEQQIWLKLFTPAERHSYFAEFLVDGLLRGDIMSRYQAYAVGRQNGWLSANDVRRVENMNPIDGGDEYLVPLNMVPAGSAGETDITMDAQRAQRFVESVAGPVGVVTNVISDGDEQRKGIEQRAAQTARRRRRLMISYRRVFGDTAKRVMRRETNDIRRAAERYLSKGDLGGFQGWYAGFVAQQEDWLATAMAPIYAAYSDQVSQLAEDEVQAKRTELCLADVEKRLADWGELRAAKLDKAVSAYTLSYAQRHVATSQQRLNQRLQSAQAKEADLLEEIEDELDHWDDVRPGEIADEESSRSNNYFATVVYGVLGVMRIISVAFGSSCPYCSALDGRTVSLNEYYIKAGEEFQPEGADRPLKSHYDLGHAPYHGGCDCMNMAA